MDSEQRRVNRVEVIDRTGRVFVGYFDKGGANLAIQDDGRTLKVFLYGKLEEG